jgi:hypothetical protein
VHPIRRDRIRHARSYLAGSGASELSYLVVSVRVMTVAELPYAAGVADVVRPVLTVVLDDVSDDALGVEELGSRIVGLAGRLAAATCRWLLLVAAFDAREGDARFGLASTARWVSHYCGLSRRTAMEHVRVARALAAHEPLAAAMGAGRLSFSQVRAISRLADLGEDRLLTELIMVAEHGTVGQLEDTVRGLRTVDDNQQLHRDPDPESLSHRWRSDSRWGLSATLEPERGALVQSAIETLARREGLTLAQALTRIAEIALAALAVDDGPAPSLRGDEQSAVLIHLDAQAVEHPQPGGPVSAEAESELERLGRAVEALAAQGRRSRERPRPRRRPYARIEGGPGLPDRVIEQLLCSSRIRVATFDPRVAPGQAKIPLDVGATRRVVSKRQFRALLLRGGGSAHPGCGSRIGLEAHHVRHWLYGGLTVLANLVLLCRRHHHAHHDGEFGIRALGNQRFRFMRADGAEIPDHVDPTRLAATTRNIEDEHDHLAPDAATTRWDGTRLDRDYALAGLAQRLHSTTRLSA